MVEVARAPDWRPIWVVSIAKWSGSVSVTAMQKQESNRLFLQTRVICLALAILITGCRGHKPAATHTRVRLDSTHKPWTHLQFNDDPKNFQFVVVSDRTGGARRGVFEDSLRKINLLQPEFVMSVGDLIQGGTSDRQLISAQWQEFRSFVDQLQMPFFFVPGNHDIRTK